MATLTANRTTYDTKGTAIPQSYPVDGGSTIYKGSLCSINAAGYLVPSTDTAGEIVVGISSEEVDNSAGSDGDLECVVLAGFVVELNASSIAQTSVPLKVYVVDDNTIDETTPANSVIAGLLVEVISSTKGMVFIPPYGQTAGL